MAQTFAINKTQFITGNFPATCINSIIPTLDNGLLFAGFSISHPGGIVPTLPIDTVNDNVLIGKMDSNFNVSWLKVFGGSDEDVSFSTCETSDGGYGVLGATSSLNGDVTGNRGASDIWLLRLDKNGGLLWQKTYGSSNSDGGISIKPTPDKGFILLGETNGNDGDVPLHYGGLFSLDWLVIKVDSTGNVQWTKDIGGTGGEEGGSVICSGSSYYLVASTNSTDHDCTDTAWHSGVYTSTNYHIIKLNQWGDIQWDKSYGGSNADDVGEAIYDESDHTVVINGTTQSNDHFVTGYHTCLDAGDMWVVKIDTNGNLLWQKTLGSIQIERGYSLCKSKENGYIVYGYSSHPNCRDPSYSNIGSSDCLLFAIDNNGNEVAHKIFGGTDYELPYKIAPFKDGCAAVGISVSEYFSQGATIGRYAEGQEGFISYAGLWPLSIDDLLTTGGRLAVYPNPAILNVTIQLPQVANGNLTIFNQMGQKVFQKKNALPDTLTIDVGQWSQGVYLVKWGGGDGLTLTTSFIR